ncbi:hypothetical protein D3C73_867170 [compost metagenome]
MIDFHPGEHQALALPITEHLLNPCSSFFLIQRRKLAIQTHHRDQRSAISLEQRRVNARPTPSGAGKSLQGENPESREIGAAVIERGLVGRRPLPLPDINLLIERRTVLPLAAIEQHQRCQQHRQSSNKNHEASF